MKSEKYRNDLTVRKIFVLEQNIVFKPSCTSMIFIPRTWKAGRKRDSGSFLVTGDVSSVPTHVVYDIENIFLCLSLDTLSRYTVRVVNLFDANPYLLFLIC